MRTKTVVLFLVLLAAIGAAIILLKGSGEDSWICTDGQWVKHGNPSTSMPTTICPGGKEPELSEGASGQKYATYSDASFQILYPYWPIIDTNTLTKIETTLVAVNNNGCNFILMKHTVPANETLEMHTEKTLKEQQDKLPVNVTRKLITKDRTTVEADLSVNAETVIHSAQNGFLTPSGELYSAVFVGATKDFAKICRPFIEETVTSAKVAGKL
ncbi:MAG: hypothetical protein PHH13_05085 [Candidatus Peribacteraceae bacterium]|nr:hypothetical protein [Candidatus Peribacteraceae bacterium]